MGSSLFPLIRSHARTHSHLCPRIIALMGEAAKAKYYIISLWGTEQMGRSLIGRHSPAASNYFRTDGHGNLNDSDPTALLRMRCFAALNSASDKYPAAINSANLANGSATCDDDALEAGTHAAAPVDPVGWDGGPCK